MKTKSGSTVAGLHVEYTVRFKALIKVDPDDYLEDVLSNIEIPEGPEGQYMKDSLDVDAVSAVTDFGQTILGYGGYPEGSLGNLFTKE